MCLSAGPLWPLCSLEQWVHCISPDRTVFDALGLLNDFVRQVVTSRRDAGLSSWAPWLPEDLGARPYHLLRLHFVPPSPCYVGQGDQVFS